MITVIDHGEVRELRLSRPPANALSPEMLVRLSELVELAPREGARALVVSGASGMFSAGLDVPALLSLDRAAMLDAWQVFHRAMRAFAASAVPVVAALTGHSPGGGCVLALFCDRRVMASGPFKVGLNEVAVGIPLPRVIFAAARRLLGARRVEEMASSAVLVDAETALGFGLVDEVAPPAEVVDRALGWCRRLLALPPHAFGETRAMLRADLVALFDGLDRAALEAELDRCWYGEEAQTSLHALVRRLKERG